MTDDEFEVLAYSVTQSAEAAKAARTISKTQAHALITVGLATLALAEAVRTFAQAVTPPEEKP